MSERYYTGVGSRKTPQDWLERFQWTGRHLGRFGFILRSGRAVGADQAFESGCDEGGYSKQIFLPTPKFQIDFPAKSGKLYDSATEEASRIAQEMLGASHWNRCNDFARKAHSRNVHQVLGFDCSCPSEFLICWTPVIYGKPQGGTATAIKVANASGIPVFNVFLESDVTRLRDKMKLGVLDSVDTVNVEVS